MHINSNDFSALVAFHAVSVRTGVDLIHQATAADLTRPTPCTGWSLHNLLDHLTEQNDIFAAASLGAPAPGKAHSRALDPIAAFSESSERLLAAFAADGVLERGFVLTEFGTDTPFPAAQAIGFHFIDSVVHAWDLAKTLGLPVHFDDDLLAAALTVARSVPGGEARTVPGAAFGPEVAWPSEPSLDKIVALLGRSPEWNGSLAA
jgi:uncharacterized protein (TIGR03086 family)